MPPQPQLVRELGSILRNQVPSARASVLDAYGETLFRAWRGASGACALEVEALIQARTRYLLLCMHVDLRWVPVDLTPASARPSPTVLTVLQRLPARDQVR